MRAAQRLDFPPEIVIMTGYAIGQLGHPGGGGRHRGIPREAVRDAPPGRHRAPRDRAPSAHAGERPPPGRDREPAPGNGDAALHLPDRQRHPGRPGGAAPDLPRAGVPRRGRHRRGVSPGRAVRPAHAERGLSRAEGDDGGVPGQPDPARGSGIPSRHLGEPPPRLLRRRRGGPALQLRAVPDLPPPVRPRAPAAARRAGRGRVLFRLVEGPQELHRARAGPRGERGRAGDDGAAPRAPLRAGRPGVAAAPGALRDLASARGGRGRGGDPHPAGQRGDRAPRGRGRRHPPRRGRRSGGEGPDRLGGAAHEPGAGRPGRRPERRGGRQRPPRGHTRTSPRTTGSTRPTGKGRASTASTPPSASRCRSRGA